MEKVLTFELSPNDGPVMIDRYIADGGYAALDKAIGMDSGEITALVDQSGLRGRGGAGFPTGFKWKAMPDPDTCSHPRYILCNFDEMEPGTFKDKYLALNNPHVILEGLIIAAKAVQADIGYIFLRGEYKKVRKVLEEAIAEIRKKGLLERSKLGFDFELHIHMSAGRYMCGEETALINALEGKRANPRSKPPYPQQCGLFGKPTLVQNVETLANIPAIVRNGTDWFKSQAKHKNGGTKLYGVSGRVKTPGCWELPMGSTLREVIYEHGGGMQDGYEFAAALPGGASTMFMGPDHLDTPLDFDTLKEHGLSMGTGTVIVLDDKTCPVAATANLAKFYARESCGWCTPCREGLPWVHALLVDIEEGRGVNGDYEELVKQIEMIGPNTYCAFAAGASFPILSALMMFEDVFKEHIRLGRCTYRLEKQAAGR